VHLLTAEAIDLYLRHLRPDGVLLFHVTNRYLELGPALARIARAKGLKTALISYEPTDGEEEMQYASSDWAVISRDGAIFDHPEVAAVAEPVEVRERTPLWTDDFNNLLRVLR